MSESDTETTVTTPSPSFSSLPDEIVVNCLARISKSYYPKLSVVSKTFRSLILSNELSVARVQLGTAEIFFNVCLQLSSCHRPSWFVLRIKPDQALTNDLENKHASIGNPLLVPIPSGSRGVPLFIVTTDSEHYAFNQNHVPSRAVYVCKTEDWVWREAARMTVARASPVAAVLDGKIYVMGGCEADETAKWAEVFDPKTQTWESLPDPGPELRFSRIKTTEVIEGKLYVVTDGNDYVYDPKEGKWGAVAKLMSTCVIIENVWYWCDGRSFMWCDDPTREEWRLVRGLGMLCTRFLCGVVEIATTYDGKLLVLWDEFGRFGTHTIGPCRHKNIWCAGITFERRNDDEVLGNIEWANLVLTVPSSYVFLRTRLTSS